MRVIQIAVPSRRLEATTDVLDEEGIDYIVTDATGPEGEPIVEFPIPRQAVEHVLDELRDVGVPVDDGYRVNLHADVAQTSNLDAMVSRFVRGREENDYVAREELRARALDTNPRSVTYYVMTFVAVVVATSGLLLNSPAIVVGSMVVAPQLGAALTSSVGIVINDREMIVDGLGSQVVGLALGIVGSVAFAILLRSTMLITPVLNIGAISQIGGRVSPGVLSVVVAAAAGTAAVFSLASHDSPSGALVGVMVSAALVPAAATAGLGVAWGIPRVAFGALALLLINVVTINLTGPFVLWLLGYRPEEWTTAPIRLERSLGDTLRTVRRYAPAAVAVLLLVGTMATGGLAFSHQVTYEQSVKSSIDEVLDRPKYDQVQLKNVQVTRDLPGPSGSGQSQVTIDIGTQGKTHSNLDRTIKRQILRDTGLPVSVSVRRTSNQSTSEAVAPDSTASAAVRWNPDGEAASAPA